MAGVAPISFEGKVVLVTGSTRGIGEEIARTFAGLGASVMISGRDSARAAEVRDVLGRETTGQVACFSGDLTEDGCPERLIARTIAALGGLDVLIGNAGAQVLGVTSTIADDDFDLMLSANLRANHLLAKAALPGMVAQGSGAIVLVSSIAAFLGSARFGTYALSKAAELALVRTISAEAAPSGVRANAVLPGTIRTEMSQRIWRDPELLAAHSRRLPLRRMGEPGDVARAVAFLASDWAAFITGQAVVVDGGATTTLDVLNER